MRTCLITIIVLMMSTQIILAAPPPNDECQDAIEIFPLQRGGSPIDGTTINATPTPLLSADCANPNSRDVWYWIDDLGKSLYYICLQKEGKNIPELALFLQNQLYCDYIDCNYFGGSATGFEKNRRLGPYPTNIIVSNDNTNSADLDAFIIVKETEQNRGQDFTLFADLLNFPEVDAGEDTIFFCACRNNTTQLNGTASPKNGGSITEYSWKMVKLIQGDNAIIERENSTSTPLTFFGKGPFEAIVSLTARETANITCNSKISLPGITGRDTVIVIGNSPRLHFPDTIIVTPNRPTVLQDTLTDTGCIDGRDTWSWKPSIGLDNPNVRNPTITTKVNRTYTVTLSCSEFKEAQLVYVKVDLTAISEQPELNAYVINGNQLVIKSAKGFDESLTASIFGINGRMVASYSYQDFEANEDKLVVQLNKKENMNNGIYFLTIQQDNSAHKMKVVICN
jgi:hypothetical protein